MSQKDVITLVKSALYRSNAQQIPSALVSSTDANSLQLLHLLYAVGEELRSLGGWTTLKRKFKIRLVAQQSRYDLPADFYQMLPFTQYDGVNSWAAAGPMPDAEWNARVVGSDFLGNPRAFRLFGYKSSQVEVSPTPGDSDAGGYIQIEYVSKSWLQPPAFTASEAAVAQNTYRQAAGITYKKTDSGSDTLGSVTPTMEFGEGQDGECRLLAITTGAFATTTLYRAGEYFIAGGARLYRVTIGGTSGSSTPTSTTEDTDITTGSCTIRYHSTSTWAGLTDKEAGDYVTVSTQYYRYETGGKSGKDTPSWSTTVFTSNTADLTHQNIAYEELVTDNDFTVFDDELVIAGLRAKLFQARGLGSEDLVYTYERLKSAAKGRWHVGKVIDWGAGFGDCYGEGPSLLVGPNWTVT